MSRLMITLAATALFAADMTALPAPAEAQDQQNSVAEIIVYGTDPCPRSTDDQVVVCARRPESERYRLPQQYRPSGTRQQTQSWANNARALETAGATGVNSCSPVGPGGFTGCLTQVIREAKQQRKEANEENRIPNQ